MMFLRAPLHVRALYQVARGVGAGLIAYTVLFFMFTYAPLIQEEFSFYSRGGKAPESFQSLLDKARASDTAATQQEAAKFGVNSYFSLVIPKLDAKENIIANVDAADEKSYIPALEEGIAHAAGTYFPGQGKRIYLFSHSTTNNAFNFARYNAVFYLLKNLEVGDEIVVFFADKKYVYKVTKKIVAAADDTSWLKETGTEEELVLQTCDPPGTTWKRLLVIAKPVVD